MKADITKLKNGLRVISQTRKDIETVSIGIWVRTGSAYEKESMNGISHFLEHMVFKGTQKRDSFAITEELERVGGHVNAYTSREFTSYYAKMLKNDAELAVDVLADLIMAPTFPKEELIKEREVVVQEIKQSVDTPDDIIFDYLQETAFAKQPLGRSILGPQDKVRSFTEKTLRSYMKTNYAASNTVVCAVGNIKHSKFVKMVQQRMGGMQQDVSFKLQKQKYTGGHFAEKRNVEQVQVTLGFEGINYYDETYYANVLLSNIFGGGMSSRLFKEVREKRGLAYSVYSFLNAHSQTGFNGIYAGTSADQLNELMPVIADEINKLRNEKVSQEEINKAKIQTKAGLLMGIESTASTCDILARQMLIYDRVISIKEILNKIENTTRDDLQDMAIKVLSTKPTYALLGKLKKHPSYENLQKWLER